MHMYTYSCTYTYTSIYRVQIQAREGSRAACAGVSESTRVAESTRVSVTETPDTACRHVSMRLEFPDDVGILYNSPRVQSSSPCCVLTL